jgi:hypothetical protein
MANKVKTTKTKAVQTVDAAEINVVAPAVAEQTPAAATETKPQLGRPVNPESERQKRLREIEEKRAQGLIKRGRPVKEGSAHQQKLAAQAARREANGGEARRGRPVDPNSPRQQRLAAQAAKVAAGAVIKPGRPAGQNNSTAPAVEVQVNA